VSRAQLREHLIRTRVAGTVATPRDNNLRAMRRLAAGDEESWFGIERSRDYSFDEALAIMVERCGVHPDPSYAEGPDTIDPDLTLDALEAMATRLTKSARARERVFFATGHPIGLMAIHGPVLRALREAGCDVLTPEAGLSYEDDGRHRNVRYVGGVAATSSHGLLRHTHSAVPMRLLLDRGLAPDLVMADHGWAGAAGQAGIDTMGFADCNDPALFVGELEGKVRVVVPLDDNVRTRHYEPITRMLVEAIGGGAS
jgi:hypothetical protein